MRRGFQSPADIWVRAIDSIGRSGSIGDSDSPTVRQGLKSLSHS
ncbi:hypothetical protein [Microcoleus sp. K5-D4]